MRQCQYKASQKLMSFSSLFACFSCSSNFFFLSEYFKKKTLHCSQPKVPLEWIRVILDRYAGKEAMYLLRAKYDGYFFIIQQTYKKYD
jgi:hypothetical protein